MNRTLDRRRDFRSPTEADLQCPYFKNRFFQWGAVDKVACCELNSESPACDYRWVQEDGTRICIRYDYMPYPIIEDGTPPKTPLDPIPYLRAAENLTPKTVPNANGGVDPLYLDTTVTPPVETINPTGVDADGNPVSFEPVMLSNKREWFSNQCQDSHQKVWGVNGELGWHHDV